LNRFYRGATPARIAEVEGQLADALSARGARVRKGEYVKARSRAHLDRCIEETIAQGVKDPDKAIVVVLRKLGDPEKDRNGDYPIEAERATEGRRRARANTNASDGNSPSNGGKTTPTR
jgi:hypothetical protein